MKKIFLDLDGTIARFNVRNALERFATEQGFFARLRPYVGIEVINTLAKMGNIYIISASPNLQADCDKMQWIARYLSNVPLKNITICRVGENKADIIKSKYKMEIDSSCYLLDDYTKNLIEWESAGGVGIKRITSVADNSTGKWTGLALTKLCQLGQVVA